MDSKTVFLSDRNIVGQRHNVTGAWQTSGFPVVSFSWNIACYSNLAYFILLSSSQKQYKSTRLTKQETVLVDVTGGENRTCVPVDILP